MANGRRRSALVLAVALTLAGAAAIPSATAQEPPNAGAGKGKANVARKKPARRKPKNAAVGVIVPWMMPPSLIIRQTPEAHDEIQALLNMLRYQ